jgi:hypothetical protein
MMMPFMKTDDLLYIKENIDSFQEYFIEDSNEWIEREAGHSVFSDSKYTMPDVYLDMSFERPNESDIENVPNFFEKFKFLSDSQASDERLWAALCLGPFWKYVQYRWNIKNDHSANKIKQHYFFDFGPRRSLTRNAISRLWWTARLTYDPNADDPYELTKYVCKNSRFIVDVLERNTSNNPEIVRPFLRATIDANAEGIQIDSNKMRVLERYLDELGGIYILDCLSEKVIHDKILNKAEELFKSN